MCLASVVHYNPHAEAAFYTFLHKPCACLKSYARFMKNKLVQLGSVSPLLALYMFMIGVLLLSPTVRI
jgi:hypothetical protein